MPKKKKKRAPGAGRPVGPTDKPRTKTLSVRVTVEHFAIFQSNVPKKERRKWLESKIESAAKQASIRLPGQSANTSK